MACSPEVLASSMGGHLGLRSFGFGSGLASYSGTPGGCAPAATLRVSATEAAKSVVDLIIPLALCFAVRH
jgi:hypothetical protein